MAVSTTTTSSTEPPSFLEPGLVPVKLKYVALPAPVTLPTENLITITATDVMRPPCRRCLQDASPGEVLHLIGYDPFPADSVTPYRGSGPIFVHTECETFDGDKMPEKQARRLLSVRAYSDTHMLLASEVTNGSEFEDVAGGMLADQKAAYVHVHNAKPGCFAFRVDRA